MKTELHLASAAAAPSEGPGFVSSSFYDRQQSSRAEVEPCGVLNCVVCMIYFYQTCKRCLTMFRNTETFDKE